MKEASETLASGWSVLARSPLLRVLWIGGLVLLLQLPLRFVWEVVEERRETSQGAVGQIVEGWGGAQTLVGPLLVIPFRSATGDFADLSDHEVRYAYFLPERLEVEGEIASEVRYRGIFEVPVYRSRLILSGSFSRPDFESLGVAPEAVLWSRAELVLELGDPRAIQNALAVEWSGSSQAFRPGPGQGWRGARGVHVPLAVDWSRDAHPFSIPLALNGSSELLLTPLGELTRVVLRSDWTEPSFTGSWLPAEREVSQEGFRASWEIPHLGRDYPQRWLEGGLDPSVVADSRFGVRLFSPVTHYTMTERSLKYAILFLGLTFATFWLFEVLAGLRVHPLQYLMVGSAMCLFYMLELSLSEHLGFAAAFAIASVAVVALVSSYALAVLQTGKRAAVLAGVASSLYGYLYVLLKEQDYALVFGSFGLFAALAIVMFATRRVDWSRVGGALERRVGEPASGIGSQD